MTPATLELTASQEIAFAQLIGGTDNLFLTGGPGTGKSFLVTQFLKESKEKIPVIASTGAAAILVGGRTFHSFFGLGIMQGGPKAAADRAFKNSGLRRRIRKIKTVIIDEVSMISCEAFDTAEHICRVIRGGEGAWGGVRVIAVGDFAQLPPISRGKDKQWCFLGAAWARSGFQKRVLEEVKRTDDKEFLEILEEVRWGKVTQSVIDYLDDRVISDEEVELDVPHVFPLRSQTDAFNKARLAEIKHPTEIYKTEYGGPDRSIEQLMKNAPIPPILELKKTALIMMRMNDPKQRYVNGSVGRILDLYEDAILVEINGRSMEIEPFVFNLLDGDGKEVAFAKNFPVTLAYANTIHKMQGATLDRVHLNLKSLWEPGQAYVALSRARSGKGITLMGWDSCSFKADECVRTFYED